MDQRLAFLTAAKWLLMFFETALLFVMGRMMWVSIFPTIRKTPDDIDETETDPSKPTIMITGGTGVLGWRVAVFARKQWPDANIAVFDISAPPPRRQLEGEIVVSIYSFTLCCEFQMPCLSFLCVY